MKSTKISTRGMLVSFEDPYRTNVYIIFGDDHVFVLDTFLGPDSMNYVLQEIEDRDSGNLPIVVFNSHADYDHYWGNCAFVGSDIVSHELCKKRILFESEDALIKHANEKKGEVLIVPPTITFQDTLRFENDEVIFFYSPGHTIDSSSCFDKKDRVLFVGDNVESPIPYLNHANFDQYIKTLEMYLEIDSKAMIAGHDPVMQSSDLIYQNLRYLSSFKSWEFELESMESTELHRHIEHNLETLKDELMKSKYRENFIRHLKEVNHLQLNR
jgi:cyclase